MAEVTKNSMENTENESKYANQSDKGGDGNTLSDNQKEKDKRDSKSSGSMPVIGEHYLVRRPDGTWRKSTDAIGFLEFHFV